jgi:protein TonB
VVVLAVVVAADGQPRTVTLHSSSGSPMLDDAALQAVRGWRFVPATRGGHAVEASVEVPVRFSLNDS